MKTRRRLEIGKVLPRAAVVRSWPLLHRPPMRSKRLARVFWHPCARVARHPHYLHEPLRPEEDHHRSKPVWRHSITSAHEGLCVAAGQRVPNEEYRFGANEVEEPHNVEAVKSAMMHVKCSMKCRNKLCFPHGGQGRRHDLGLQARQAVGSRGLLPNIAVPMGGLKHKITVYRWMSIL
jgi:hypothetical protein